MSFMDRTIQCSDCGISFAFTAGEQYFYVSKSFYTEPKRCLSCRWARKSEEYGNCSYGHSTPRQMFRATCTDCGKDTEVPFQPRTGKTVYCSGCYHKRKLNTLVDRCIAAIAAANPYRVGSTGLALSAYTG
jgi:CxxC-x17-CxxC domain-containing protein